MHRLLTSTIVASALLALGCSRGGFSGETTRDFGGDIPASETTVDSGADLSSVIDTSGSCEPVGCASKFCFEGRCDVPATCLEIAGTPLNTGDGIYEVDVDRLAGPKSPFQVRCDMSDGGWTQVAFEASGAGGYRIQGALPYLGVESGSPEAIAKQEAPGILGVLFAGRYTQVKVLWGEEQIVFSPSKEIFLDQVDLAIPLTDLTSSDAVFNGWISGGGGAIFCRASKAF
ncbi:MAG: hypothetical protein JRH20_30025, partial [Deltaproteobacteria bacterium]|nr:hypothetical protein [Deltaproteobacteria bacterium]